MKRSFLSFLTLLTFLASSQLHAQQATVREYSRTFLTYPYGDPNPIARTGKIYPYYRFDGYATKGINHDWKIVELENDWIKVLIAPEMGGKILGAIEKSTGKEFIYFNKVVKFRDIAMRGAWTSGGIEFNFGSIGNAPTTASPVDYQFGPTRMAVHPALSEPWILPREPNGGLRSGCPATKPGSKPTCFGIIRWT
jgi:hypothetical protein